MNDQTNGTLEPQRVAAIDLTVTQYHAMAQERDDLIRKTNDMLVMIEGLKAATREQESTISRLESELRSVGIQRDEERAARIKYEALHASASALYRAFQVPVTPLIRDTTDDSPYVSDAMTELRRAMNAMTHDDRYNEMSGLTPLKRQ
jgi:type II secretory pathway component HofQ